MAEIISDSSDDQRGWHEMTSGKGNKYRVKAEGYNIAQKSGDDDITASGPAFDDIHVSWEPNTEGAPSQQEQDISGIVYYKYSEAPFGSTYPWQLTIISENTHNYVFTDKTGDTYSLNVWRDGCSHHVGFISEDPEITTIRGV